MKRLSNKGRYKNKRKPFKCKTTGNYYETLLGYLQVHCFRLMLDKELQNQEQKKMMIEVEKQSDREQVLRAAEQKRMLDE